MFCYGLGQENIEVILMDQPPPVKKVDFFKTKSNKFYIQHALKTFFLNSVLSPLSTGSNEIFFFKGETKLISSFFDALPSSLSSPPKLNFSRCLWTFIVLVLIKIIKVKKKYS